MKAEHEIEFMLKRMRGEIETPLCGKCDNVLIARIGTLLWVLDRENESIQEPLKQTEREL